MLEKLKTPLTSVVVLAVPLVTTAPCTGFPAWSMTLPFIPAVTIVSGGILLPVVVEPSDEPVFLQAATPIERMRAVRAMERSVDFIGPGIYCVRCTLRLPVTG